MSCWLEHFRRHFGVDGIDNFFDHFLIDVGVFGHHQDGVEQRFLFEVLYAFAVHVLLEVGEVEVCVDVGDVEVGSDDQLVEDGVVSEVLPLLGSARDYPLVVLLVQGDLRVEDFFSSELSLDVARGGSVVDIVKPREGVLEVHLLGVLEGGCSLSRTWFIFGEGVRRLRRGFAEPDFLEVCLCEHRAEVVDESLDGLEADVHDR